MSEHIPVYPLTGAGKTPEPIVVREERRDRFQPDPDLLIPHRKDYYLFVLVRTGESRHWIDARSYTLQPDHFYFTVPHQVHLKEDTRPMDGLIVCFTREFLELEENSPVIRLPLLENGANGHELRLSVPDVGFLDHAMRQMLYEFEHDRGWRRPLLGVWLHRMLTYLNRLYMEQFDHDQPVQDQTIELTQQQLVVEAKKRLLHTRLSAKQIGEELGFGDDAYFNRFFKRQVGLTPLAYRRHIREMYDSRPSASGGPLAGV
jgi:AraC family transcriptional regulator, transcriptional activator of pobA